jgi:glycosyltransferase involved in cell wall biosynthesis
MVWLNCNTFASFWTRSYIVAMKLAIIIPALNEEGTIGSVISAVPGKMDGISALRIFVIDNGSTDQTPQIAQNLGAELIKLKSPSLARAFMAGIGEALIWDAHIIVNLDADGQYLPEEIPTLIKPILDGEADVVIGDRQVRTLTHMPPAKKYGNMIGSWFIRVLTGAHAKETPAPSADKARAPGLPVTARSARYQTIDASSGFRAFTARAAEKFTIHAAHTYTHENLIQAHYLGLRIAQVPVTFVARPAVQAIERPTGEQDGYARSRLIKSVPVHILKSLHGIMQAWRRYRKAYPAHIKST